MDVWLAGAAASHCRLTYSLADTLTHNRVDSSTHDVLIGGMEHRLGGKAERIDQSTWHQRYLRSSARRFRAGLPLHDKEAAEKRWLLLLSP